MTRDLVKEEATEGFCQCGCGGQTKLAPQTHTEKGWVKGRPKKYLLGHVMRRRGKAPFVEEERGFKSPCWIWQAARTAGGYGQITIDGEKLYAHRVAYALLVEGIPAGRVVHHRCQQRACINPAHLEHMDARKHLGSDGHGKLSEGDVRKIRQLAAAGTNQRHIAEQFNVSRDYVNAVACRRERAEVV